MCASSETELRDTLIKYLLNAAALRVTIQRRLDDIDFGASQGHEIVYFVDADVVGLFSEPSTIGQPRKYGFEYVRLFDDQNIEYLPSTATIASEIILSQNLPGQRRSAFLLPPHESEVFNQVCWVEDRLKADAVNPPKMSKDDLNRLHDTLTRLARRPDEDGSDDDLLRYLSEQLPEMTESIKALPIQLLARTVALGRLDQSGSVRSALTTKFFDTTLMEPEKADVRNWCNRIILAKPRFGVDATVKQQAGQELNLLHTLPLREQRAVENDAMAMLQAMTLADEADANIRYLLVTGDAGLHRAYSSWFWGDEQAPRDPRKYLLRHPTQYIPLIEMDDVLSDNGGLRPRSEISEALEYLVSNYGEVDPNYPFSLPFFGHSEGRFQEWAQRAFASRAGYAPLLVSDRLGKLKANWEEAMAAAIAANYPLLVRRYKEAIVSLDHFVEYLIQLEKTLDPSNIEAAARRVKSRNLSYVNVDHIAFGAQGNLMMIIHNASFPAAHPAARSSRAPLGVLSNFQRFTGGVSLERFFTDLLVGDDPRRVREVCDAVAGHLDSLALYFSACLAARSGAWISAFFYAEKANELPVQNEDERWELTWFRALARRFTVRATQLTRLEEGLTLVESCIDMHIESWGRDNDPKHALRAARAYAEWAALFRIGCYLSVTFPEYVPVLESMKKQHTDWDFAPGTKKLEEALDRADLTLKAADRQEEIWPYAVQRIKQQILSNRLSVFLYDRVVQKIGAPTSSPERARESLGLLEKIQSMRSADTDTDTVSYMVKAHMLLTRWYLTEDEGEKVAVANQYLAHADDLIKSGRDQIPLGDWLVIRHFRQHIRNGAAA